MVCYDERTRRPAVLVVEDEAIIRMMAVDMVEGAGFEAIEAANGEAAVRILETRDDIRLVFTDIDMPGSIDGMMLAGCVRDRWPPIEIIITSGHTTPNSASMPARGVFVPKPYDPRHVGELMQRMAA